jgi:hypothetical protein
VVLFLGERNETWVLNQVEIGLNVQVLNMHLEQINIFASEQGCTRQVEQHTFFLIA